MPSKTAKQHRAMAAACKGRSNLGISWMGGCEFMHAGIKGKKKKKRR